MRPLLAVLLLLIAVPTASQTQAPTEERAAPSAPQPAPRLNLRLDDAARYSREAPREEAPAKETPGSLPTLGGNPVTERAGGTPKWGGGGPSPYPKDETPLR